MITMQDVPREKDRIVNGEVQEVINFFSQFKESLNQLTDLAKYIGESHAALINMLDSRNQYTISKAGELDVDILPIEESICRNTIKTPAPLIIEDTTSDPRTKNLDYVQNGTVQFYAGFPIINPYGPIIGTLCILDNHPRNLSDSDRNALENLASQLQIWMELFHKQQVQDEMQQAQKHLETLFSEIHHRIKNNLADIIGLLQIQESETDLKEVQDILKKTEHRISTVAQIHELLYEANTPAQTNVKKYIHRLVNTIADAFIEDRDGINFELDIEPVSLSIDQTLPFGLIVNEMVTNAIEHAFTNQKEGLIKIKIYSNGGFVTMELSDNGKGLGTSSDQGLFNFGNLGMTLIHLLSNQLNATLQIQTNRGTSYYLRFPQTGMEE
jgi:two-component sensor histidine kinase